MTPKRIKLLLTALWVVIATYPFIRGAIFNPREIMSVDQYLMLCVLIAFGVLVGHVALLTWRFLITPEYRLRKTKNFLTWFLEIKDEGKK